jgi:hypothetical protein
MANKQLRSFTLPQEQTLNPFDGNYKFRVIVKDRVSLSPIESVKVKLYKTESISNVRTTNKKGTSNFNLQIGSYGIMIKHDNYQFFMDTITVGNDDINFETLYLYPKKGVMLIPVDGSKL